MNVQSPGVADLVRLEGLFVERIDDTSFPDEVFIHTRGTYQVTGCLACEILKNVPSAVHRHGTEQQKFRDISAFGKKVWIVIERRRFRCSFCRATWSEPVPALHTKRLMTARLEDYIIRRCFVSTNTDVAREIGVDEGTIRNVFRDYVVRQKAAVKFETPEILGIDEIHMVGNHCVLTNIGKRSLFDLLPSRSKEHLAPYFRDMPDKGNVRVIAADMWRPYHQIADQFFPERLVVVDKFHVVRMANKGLDNVRKHVGRLRSKEEKIRLKDERFLLYERKGRLTPDEWDRVNGWLKAFPLLKAAYSIKEAFFDAFDEDTRAAGEKALDRCILSIPSALDPYFSEMITAVGNWKPRILNYFEGKVTNAYTESYNSLIRVVDRMGRGYNFDVLRARLLYNDVARSKKTSTRGRKHVDIPDPTTTGFFTSHGSAADYDTGIEVVEYGPDIDTLVEILTRELDEAERKQRPPS
jgi:transposase